MKCRVQNGILKVSTQKNELPILIKLYLETTHQQYYHMSTMKLVGDLLKILIDPVFIIRDQLASASFFRYWIRSQAARFW